MWSQFIGKECFDGNVLHRCRHYSDDTCIYKLCTDDLLSTAQSFLLLGGIRHSLYILFRCTVETIRPEFFVVSMIVDKLSVSPMWMCRAHSLLGHRQLAQNIYLQVQSLDVSCGQICQCMLTVLLGCVTYPQYRTSRVAFAPLVASYCTRCTWFQWFQSCPQLP